MSAYLQRPRLFAGSLDFYKGCTAFRQKHDTVRHPIETRRNEFRSDASHVFYVFNELLLDFFFSHLTSHINHNRHNCTTFPYILLTRVYAHVFTLCLKNTISYIKGMVVLCVFHQRLR